MKKLESLKATQYQVANCDLNQIKGGRAEEGSMDNSYEYSYTSIGENGESKLDAKLVDVCVDW